MKNFRLSRKVQIILATIFVIVAGAVIAGSLTNNKASALTWTCPVSGCGGSTSFYHQSGTYTHQWICNNNTGHSGIEACAGGSWTQKSGTQVHQKFCSGCGDYYTQGNCSDDDGDGSCDVCGGTVSGGSSGGGGGSSSCDGNHTPGNIVYTKKDSEYHHLKIYCANCNVMYDEYDAIHNFYSYTDNGNGTHSATCGDCSYNSTESHTSQTIPGEPATCTSYGYTSGAYCSVCDATIKEQEPISPLGHTEVTDAGKAATCTEGGLTEGEHCSKCNEILIAQYEIPPLGHTEVIVEGRAATCTEKGLTDKIYCSVCNTIIAEQEEIPALGHAEVIDKAKAATCTEVGLTEGKHCSRCNEILVAQEEILALGHAEVIDEGKVATCTEAGITEGKHCSRCNEVLVAQEEIQALGHNYENGVCSVCGKEQYSEIEIASEKYEVNDKYISKIQPGVTIEELKNNLQTNATEIKIYNQNNELLKDTDKIGTGMKIELKNGTNVKEIMAIIKGDVDGEGTSGMSDILIINKYRLNKKSLDEIYLKAGDVTGDGKVDIFDIIKINRFRLNKITEL